MRKIKNVKSEDKALKLFKLGLQLNQSGKIDEAKLIYEKVISLNPNHFDALNLLGAIFFQNGNNEAALSLINKSIQLEPSNEYSHLNRGNVLKRLGDFEGAIKSFDRAIEINSNYASAYFNRGTTLEDLNLFEDAIDSYDNALKKDNQFADAYVNKGNALINLRRFNEALENFKFALNLSPNDPETYYNLGNALKELGRLPEAIENYDIAIQFNPFYAKAYINRGNALKESNNLTEAFANYSKAIEINPNLHEAFVSLSSLQYNRNQFKEALTSASLAIQINERFAEAYLNKANAEKALGLIDESLNSLNTAISLKQHYIEANWNKSLILLLLGQYSAGFELYESRWSLPKAKPFLSSSATLWLGNESIKNKNLLLISEQGFGDTIQFSRYVLAAHDLGAKIYLQVPRPLLSLFECFKDIVVLLEQGTLPTGINLDFYCPLMSLPLAFKTQPDTIPAPSKYLSANNLKVKFWRDRLKNIKELKVGIVWNGGFRPDQPEVWAINERRNIPLDIFSSELNSLAVNFFSLQKGDPAESELREKGGYYWPNGNLYDFTDELHDFSDTAALIENLDLIISVDTSTAHLSAALGKPTWILNRFDNCWRWLLDKNNSPWYKSVKLFRQQKHGDWKEVLLNVKYELDKLSYK